MNNLKPGKNGANYRDSSHSIEGKNKGNQRGKKVQFDGGSYYDEGLMSADRGGRISGRFYDESGDMYRFFGSAEKRK
jgi:hypothetical protein